MKLSAFLTGGLFQLAIATVGSTLLAVPIAADETVIPVDATVGTITTPTPEVKVTKTMEDIEAEQIALQSGYDFGNLYDESMGMVWLSRIVYQFARLVKEARHGNNTLSVPDEIMETYGESRLDVRGMNDGHGLSFNQLYLQFASQVDELKELGIINDYDMSVIERMKKIEDSRPGDSLFLEVFDALHSKDECVYGVFKDEFAKQIVIAFRGTSHANDWLYNLSAQLIDMKTPKELVGKLKGKLSENIKVHRGFYEYIFNNKHQEGKQVYDKILADIEPFVEKGYNIHVTGHSLGAALSSMLAFKLAGSDKEWIPKPVSCISLASPFVGGSGFKTAFQQLEKDGLIRYLRITNSRDTVPTIPMVAPSLISGGRYYHVGIHLNFNDRGPYTISFPKSGNGIVRSLKSAIFLKPVWSVLKYHNIGLMDERMVGFEEQLSNITIDELYKDESIVGKGFWD